MRKMRICLIVFTLTCCISVSVLVGNEQPIEKDFAMKLRQAQTLDEFEEATIQALEKRSEFIRSLIRMLRGNPEKERMIRICYLLGEYRATEAIWDLSKHIKLEDKTTGKLKKYPRWSRYPAQEALIKCGFRSIQYMIKNLETSEDEQVRKLSAMVIWQVIGEGLPRVVDGKEYGRLIVANEADKQTDSAKKMRLASALKYFETPAKIGTKK